MPPFNFSFENQFIPCECCKVKYTTCTTTVTNGYKWSKKECEAMILDLAERLTKAKWYMRGDIRRQLKHWTEKLARYKELKEEFKS